MRALVLAAAASLAVAVPALAHHGWSSYDENRPITLTGSFTEVSWANPHATAKMRWQGREWDVVLAPIGRMTTRGLSEGEIAPGRRVTITGYARRDGGAEMRLERIRASGGIVELR